jgi:hypothetical protein
MAVVVEPPPEVAAVEMAVVEVAVADSSSTR